MNEPHGSGNTNLTRDIRATSNWRILLTLSSWALTIAALTVLPKSHPFQTNMPSPAEWARGSTDINIIMSILLWFQVPIILIGALVLM